MPKTKTKQGSARGGTLTPLQQAFVHEYAKAPKNATAAAIAAGYSPRSARVQVYDLLRNPSVKAELDQVRERITQETVYDAASSFKEAGEALELARVNDDPHGMMKAIEHRAKLNGLLIDRSRVETISVDLTAALRDAKARITAAFPRPVRPMRDPVPAIDAEYRALPSTCNAGPSDNQSDAPALGLAAARSRADRGASWAPAPIAPRADAAARMFE